MVPPARATPGHAQGCSHPRLFNALEALPDDELQSYTDIQRFLYCVGCNEKEPPVAVAHVGMRGDEVAI